MNNTLIIEKLNINGTADKSELLQLIDTISDDELELLRMYAQQKSRSVFGNKIYIRGLIEFTNICKNDCLYCGIRKSNANVIRYRLTDDEILECCKNGYELGFKTFVLQGGEDGYFTDDKICSLIEKIKDRYPDCALTLSIGERSHKSYQRMYDAGADRYLLRHETADSLHYSRLHPQNMSHQNRLSCLYTLKEIGFQTGAGFMVGSPYQTTDALAEDLLFIERLRPQMCGIGPFIPHKDTIFKDEKSGSVRLTLMLLSIIRLMNPHILLPATTALGTAEKGGRERGVLHGANVVMPNLSPVNHRADYSLYDNKLCTGNEAAENLKELEKSFAEIGYEIAYERGDYRKDV